MELKLPGVTVVWRDIKPLPGQPAYVGWLTVRRPGHEDVSMPIPFTESDVAVMKRKFIVPEWEHPLNRSLAADTNEVMRRMTEHFNARIAQAFMTLNDLFDKEEK